MTIRGNPLSSRLRLSEEALDVAVQVEIVGIWLQPGSNATPRTAAVARIHLNLNVTMNLALPAITFPPERRYLRARGYGSRFG